MKYRLFIITTLVGLSGFAQSAYSVAEDTSKTAYDVVEKTSSTAYSVFSVKRNTETTSRKKNKPSAYSGSERENRTALTRFSEAFTVSFTRSNYGVQFPQRSQKLTPELEDKLLDYLQKTRRLQFKGLGKKTIHLVKEDNTYYVRINSTYNLLEQL